MVWREMWKVLPILSFFFFKSLFLRHKWHLLNIRHFNNNNTTFYIKIRLDIHNYPNHPIPTYIYECERVDYTVPSTNHFCKFTTGHSQPVQIGNNLSNKLVKALNPCTFTPNAIITFPLWVKAQGISWAPERWGYLQVSVMGFKYLELLFYFLLSRFLHLHCFCYLAF